MTITPKHVNLRLSYELHHDLEFIAQVYGVSLNQLLVDHLQEVVTVVFAKPEFHRMIDEWVKKQTDVVEKAAAVVKALS